MKKSLTFALISAALLRVMPLQAQTLNFEGIGVGYPFLGTVPVLSFYTAAPVPRVHPAPTTAWQFSVDAEAVCLNSLVVRCSAASRDGVGDPNSRTAAMIFTNSSQTSMNRQLGMVNSLSFQYVALDPGGTAWAWSGLNGTGTLLGSLSLPASDEIGTCALYAAVFCPFSLQTLTFTGKARSIVFTGVADQAAIDDITFEAAVVPEPSTVVLFGLGLATLAVAVLRRSSGKYI